MNPIQNIQVLTDRLNSCLIGKEDKVFLTVATLLARGHLLLEDVPGVGKTTLANSLARSVNCSFGRIQFTPDTLPGDVTGLSVYNMKTGDFEYMPGAVMHHIILADEINRTSPKTQASLLEAMEEHQVTVDGVIHPLEDPFMVIATQNPIDFLGTYNLPEAQLDRFLMKLSIGYPNTDNEKRMAEAFLGGQKKNELTPVIDRVDLVAMQNECEKVMVHEDLISYIIDIVTATRTTEDLSLGASPRSTLAVLAASRAVAYMSGRDYVTPDDIQKILYPVLCHRLVLSIDARMRKMTAEYILKELLKKVKVPIIK